MTYHDAKELVIDLMVKEALGISDEYDLDYNIPRKELIEKLSAYIDKLKYYPCILKKNTKITIRLYSKINENNLVGTDTARGKETLLSFENKAKNTFVYIIDNEGNIYKKYEYI
jgi:hypothetical protein